MQPEPWDISLTCLAILREHLQLQPYIEESMPFIVRRCVTKRMLEFNIGAFSLLVSENLPTAESRAYPETLANLKPAGLNKSLTSWRRPGLSTAADDWTKLKDRMADIVELFLWYHLGRHKKKTFLSCDSNVFYYAH